ncbi:MAG: hypothetical protein M3303_00395, partial [Gemmatimonadota bacterium]|nr:hypothetical protein [Gemmatimonadota bacterium]
RRPHTGVEEVVLGIRPESFEDAAFARGDVPRIHVEAAVLEELGSDAHVFFSVDAPRITAEILESATDEAALLAESKALFTARLDPRTRVRPGERLELAVDPGRFHFFDAATGASLLGSEELQELEKDRSAAPKPAAVNVVHTSQGSR